MLISLMAQSLSEGTRKKVCNKTILPIYSCDRVKYRKNNVNLVSIPGSSDSKECTYDAGSLGLIPGLGRSTREGNGYPLLGLLSWQQKPLILPWDKRDQQTRSPYGLIGFSPALSLPLIFFYDYILQESGKMVGLTRFNH